MAERWEGDAWVIRPQPYVVFTSLWEATFWSLMASAFLVKGLQVVGAPAWPAAALVVPWLWWTSRVARYRVEITASELRHEGLFRSRRWPSDEIGALVAAGSRTLGSGPCLCLAPISEAQVAFRLIFVDSSGWPAMPTKDTAARFESIRQRIQSGELRPGISSE